MYIRSFVLELHQKPKSRKQILRKNPQKNFKKKHIIVTSIHSSLHSESKIFHLNIRCSKSIF